jgi:hypothetical protein
MVSVSDARTMNVGDHGRINSCVFWDGSAKDHFRHYFRAILAPECRLLSFPSPGTPRPLGCGRVLAYAQVPKLDRPTVVPRGQGLAVRAGCHAPYRLGMPNEANLASGWQGETIGKSCSF